jgi:hypothetical protein
MKILFAKRQSLLLFFGYAVFFCMAIFYYQERLCTDSGHYFFQTIHNGFFHIEHQRFVQAFAQWPVLAGMIFRLPLKPLAIIYSCAHVFFFYMLGQFLFLKYKNMYPWLLLLFLQIIGFQIGFINPIIEHYYGIAIGVVLFSMMRYQPNISITTFCALQVLACLLLCSHPFAVLLYLFILSFDFIHRKNIGFSLSMCIILPIYFLLKSHFASQYELDKSGWIFNTAINKTYLQLFTSNLWMQFGQLLLQYYWHWLVLLGINCLYFYTSKQYAYLLTMLFFVFGTIGVIQFAYAITSYSGQSEQACFAIIPYVLFPFFMMVLPNIGKQKLIFFLLVVIFTFGVIAQNNWMQIYTAKTKRVQEWIAIARLQTGNKFTIKQARYNDIDGLIDWDIPFYTLLISGMDGGKQVSIVPLVDNTESTIRQLLPNQYLYRFVAIEQIESLNKKYFILGNSSYHVLNE